MIRRRRQRRESKSEYLDRISLLASNIRCAVELLQEQVGVYHDMADVRRRGALVTFLVDQLDDMTRKLAVDLDAGHHLLVDRPDLDAQFRSAPGQPA